MAIYTVCDLLQQHRESAPDAVAVVDRERRVTYAALDAMARGLAAVLRTAGVGRGDRVCIFHRRSLEAVVAMLGAHYAGGVAVMINDRLKAQQVNYILAHTGAAVFVADSRLLHATAGIALGETRVIVLDDAERHAASGRDRSPAQAIGRDLAMIIYTSGSTGMPKGIMLSHTNLVAGAEIVADYLGLSASDRLISLLPFSFDYGLNQLLTALLVGGTLVIQRSPFPADICATLQRERVTGMAGVPLLWSQLAQAQSPFTRTAFPDLRYLTNSGGTFPQPLITVFCAAHPQVDLYLMYGLTEAFRSTYLPPRQVTTRPDSIGKAIPNCEMLVVSEQGAPCAPGEVGELVHRGATVALGYWRDPEATRRVFRPHPFQQEDRAGAETVVYSGDLVRQDAEGYLYFVGRKDQMIKSQGYRVSPEEIERYIAGSTLVSAAVAFAVPKNDVDVEIVAAIRFRDPETPHEERLREYCKREMPEYMRPATFWTVDDFPQTTSGKPDRLALRSTYLATARTQPPSGGAGALRRGHGHGVPEVRASAD